MCDNSYLSIKVDSISNIYINKVEISVNKLLSINKRK